MTTFKTDKSFALELDAKDPLAKYRDQFHIPKQDNGEDCIYFCGNSLGLQPKTAKAYVDQELDDWAKLGVEGHFQARHPWKPYHEFLTEQTARMVGAKPIEVVVMNTLTVNLHLMMVSFYRPRPTKHKIVIEANAFPSDQYAVQSQIKHHGFDPHASLVELSPRDGENYIRTEDIEAFIEREGDSIALILLGGVNYYSGLAFEMERITMAGHAKDCIVGFDLAHAAGNLVLNLHDWHVDFAVWWGQNKETRFQMGPDFDAIPGAEGWQLSNPPILPMAVLRAAMDIIDKAGMKKLRAKSEQLTGYLEFLLDQMLSDEIKILTPQDTNQRGCQLSIRVMQKGKSLYEILKQRGIVCDWREPDVIRVAPVPLYNTFEDVYNFSQIFSEEFQQL